MNPLPRRTTLTDGDRLLPLLNNPAMTGKHLPLRPRSPTVTVTDMVMDGDLPLQLKKPTTVMIGDRPLLLKSKPLLLPEPFLGFTRLGSR